MSELNSQPSVGEKATSSEGKIAWPPLESNPDSLNLYMKKLGVPPQFGVTDVFSLDPDCLSFVPQPCLALILLFPLTPQHEAHRKEQIALHKEESERQRVTTKPFFIPQTIKNACGTMALLHALLNNLDSIEPEKGSILSNLASELAPLTLEERSQRLEANSELATAHCDAAQMGQTGVMDSEAELDLHFTTFVHCLGRLVELDGRYPTPTDHGPCMDQNSLLSSGARHIMELIKETNSKNDKELEFCILAIVKN